MPLDVGVVGAGTAGTAAAILLARRGHAVAIYEQVPEPKPVGAGIMIQPSGLAVLARLKIAEAVTSRGAEVRRLRCVTPHGKTVVDLAYGDLDPTFYGVGLHRGVLFEELHTAAAREKIPVHTGVAIAGLVRLRGGRVALVDHEGELRGPHDLVVVADGARSRLRDATSLPKSVRPYPWGALWFVARDRDHAFDGELHQVVRGSERMLGLLPTGVGPRSSGGVPLISLFFSLRADRWPEVRRAGLAAFRDEVLALEPRAESVLDQIDDLEALTFAGYHDVVLDRWGTRNVVVLGDAAHATSPQLGQGCNLALCDAATLADVLDEEPHVPRALDRYSRERRDHLAYYQLATRWLTPFFQSDFTLLGLARDFLMAPSARIPFVRREMVRSMCGTKTGILFGSMILAKLRGESAPPALSSPVRIS